MGRRAQSSPSRLWPASNRELRSQKAATSYVQKPHVPVTLRGLCTHRSLTKLVVIKERKLTVDLGFVKEHSNRSTARADVLYLYITVCKKSQSFDRLAIASHRSIPDKPVFKFI